MVPLAVIVSDVFLNGPPKMGLPKWNDPIEAFALDGQDKSLTPPTTIAIHATRNCNGSGSGSAPLSADDVSLIRSLYGPRSCL